MGLELTDLQTERLILEPLKAVHAPLLYPMLQPESLYTYIPFDAPLDVASLIANYERRSIVQAPGRDEIWLNWAARLKNSTDYIGIFEATVMANASMKVATPYFPNISVKAMPSRRCRQ